MKNKILSLLLIMLILPVTTRADNYQPGVVLSFDDYYVNQWYDFFIGRNDVKATFFISNYDDFTPVMINKLKQLEIQGHEIGFHTRSHLGIASHFNSDSSRIQEYLDDQIIPTLNKMKADGFNPVSFSYPFGEHTQDYDVALNTYFPYLRSTYADINTPLAEIDQVFHNKEKNYTFLSGDGIDDSYQNNLAEIEAALIRAKTNGEIITLYAHEILANNDVNTEYAVRFHKLNGVINKAKQLGLKFYTFKDAYQAGNKGIVTTSVIGNNVHITWNNIANDFIGIVPADQNQWQQGMPSITTDGNLSGTTQINVPNPVNKQEYVAIFYRNNIKVFTTLPFVILDLMDASQPPEIITPKGVTHRQADGSVVLKWKAVLGAASYDYDGYQTNADGVIDWNTLIFEKNITAEEAGCATSSICSVTETIANPYNVWEIRANLEGLETNYSDFSEFSLVNDIVSDTTPPVITLSGTDPVSISKGSNYIDAGATALDNIDGPVTVVVDTSAVNTAIAATYTVTFTATDQAGNVAHASRIVIVEDRSRVPATPEIISPAPDSTVNKNTILKWKAVTGASHYDIKAYAARKNKKIRWNKRLFKLSISAEAAGCEQGGICQTSKQIRTKYAVWAIRSRNQTGNSRYTGYTFFHTRKGSKKDRQAPVITINGANPVRISLGSIYSDAGATAVDNVDGTVDIQVNSSAVNTSRPGIYKVSFTATDKAGNSSQKIRTVIVKESRPLTPPEVISPTSGSTSQTNRVVFSWKAIPGAESYEVEVLEARANEDIIWDKYLVGKSVSPAEAGCETTPTCKITETLSVKYAVWSIRTNYSNSDSEYTDYIFFTINDSTPPAGQKIRIMPLGDSITEGIDGHPSYRRNLWHMLQQGGYNVDFVGSTNNLNSELGDFDLDHEGHSGWEAGEIANNLTQWLTNITPDIVMLHVGTNDLTNGQDDASTLQEIDDIINKLRIKNSSVIILLAKIIPMRHYDTATFNSNIDPFAAERNTPQSPIIVVDQYTGYNAQLDNFDNYHPNASGEEKMANTWLEALRPFLPVQ